MKSQRERKRARNENRKLTFFFSSPEVAGREKKESRGERRKESREERKKRESGKENVTNVTYHTNIIVIDIVSYDIVIYVYIGVKTEEKRASPDTYSIMYI